MVFIVMQSEDETDDKYVIFPDKGNGKSLFQV